MGAAKKKKNTRDTKRKGKKKPLRRGEKRKIGLNNSGRKATFKN